MPSLHLFCPEELSAGYLPNSPFTVTARWFGTLSQQLRTASGMRTKLRFFRGKKGAEIQPSRQVRTKYGLVEGIRLVNDDDCQIDAFLGIPFAKPPIGQLRFKKPEAPEPWEGVRKVVRFGPRPPQKDIFIWERWTTAVKMSEDCLYLNVFSPAWIPAEKQSNGFAVMVFVHGGGFSMDSASRYGTISICNSLCRKDVIVVTIEYRLGYLGFFCTGDEACPGNNGLWDQTMALRWVKENIGAFNGDPNRITMFGQSAGGASVDLLSLSPISRDLFQQLIPMAGNAECSWAVVDTERIVDACKRFARKVGWKYSDDTGPENHEKMLDFLRTLPAKMFMCNMFEKMDSRRAGLDLAPVIDGEFLPEPVAQLRQNAPLKNCMVGACEYEGLLFAAILRNSLTLRGLDKLLTYYIPAEEHSNYEEMRRNAKQFYMADVNSNDKLAISKICAKLCGDLFIINGTADYAEKMASLGHEVYLYSFDHFNPKSFGLLSLRIPFKGATHCTEIAYILGVSVTVQFRFTQVDEQVKDLTTKLWTNFAKFGNPNGLNNAQITDGLKWLPVERDKPLRYLSIGSLNYQMKEEYADRRAAFWRNLENEAASSAVTF